jgi:hypothetical protein
LGALTLQNADDTAGFRRTVVPAKTFSPWIAPNEDSIFMQGGAGIAFGDGNLLKLRIIRLQKSFAGAIHADASRNEVGFDGGDVTIAFDAGNFAGLFELAQGGLQGLLSMGWLSQQPE